MKKEIGLLLLLCVVLSSCNLSVQQTEDIRVEKIEASLRAGIKDSVWLAQGKPNDYYRYDTLKSTIKDLPEVLVYSLYGLPQLTNVGDIDGDGFDEIGFFSTAYESNWTYYDVYSVKNVRWHELKERPYVFTLGFQESNPIPKIIESTVDGRVKILKMKFDDVAIVCDTIIEPIFEMLPFAKKHAFIDSLLSDEKNSIIGEWSHKSDPGTIVLYYCDNNPYMAFIEDSIIVKNTMMREFESFDGYRAFEPSEIIYGERATAYYRIIGDRLLERPIDGTGADYWFEPIKY